MARSIWSGSISFGLVNIPVNLYSVAEPREIGFHMLCSKCNTRLHYKRYCPKCKKEVSWEKVVKGIEYKKGKYFVMTKKAIAELKPERTDCIEIKEFVPMKQIPQIYFDRHYYVGPSTVKAKAFYLFKEVLHSTATAAIGTLIIRDKEHVCAIESYKTGLLLTTLHYGNETRDINEVISKRSVTFTKQELNLATKIIKKQYKTSFSIGKYKDRFAEELKKKIIAKLKGKKIPVKKKKAVPKTLMAQLKASAK